MPRVFGASVWICTTQSDNPQTVIKRIPGYSRYSSIIMAIDDALTITITNQWLHLEFVVPNKKIMDLISRDNNPLNSRNLIKKVWSKIEYCHCFDLLVDN